jgi:hypothetical protein
MYSLELPLTYKVVRAGSAVVKGRAVTKSIGAKVLRLVSESPIPVGVAVELHVDWPARLSNGPNLRLIVYGRTAPPLHSATGEQTVHILKYEFRVRSAETAAR